MNENDLNETIKCECFGIGMFQGQKCETKSIKYKRFQVTVKSTAYMAIIILVTLCLLVVLSDLHNLIAKPTRISIKNIKKNNKA